MRWALQSWQSVPWDFVLVLVVLGVLVPWRGAVRIRQLLSRPRLETADRLAIYASTIAFQWLAVAFVAWRCYVRGIRATQLGLVFSEPERTAATALGLAFLLAANQLFSLRRLARLAPERRGFPYQMAQKLMPHNLIEALAFVALAATVALCEEFLYRGFVLAVLQDTFAGSALLAALGSSALFALAHLYQGRRGLRATFIVGVVFAGARILTASLAPPILAHLVVDLVAGLAGPRILSAPVAATHREAQHGSDQGRSEPGPTAAGKPVPSVPESEGSRGNL